MVRPTLDSTFRLLADRNEAALILFITGGDPSLEDLPTLIEDLVEAGADALEIGLPFSDPIADGPSIQASSQRALDRGVTPPAVLEAIGRARVDVPVVVMGYLNPMLQMGFEAFADRCQAVGVSGVIVCDLIPEEAGEWVQIAQSRGLATVFLAAPTSAADRLDAVANASCGFVYAVARTGVTGTQAEQANESERLVADLRARTSTPIAVGFGISTPDHVAAVSRFADGAIVGSALVDRLAQPGSDRKDVLDWVRQLKAATCQG